MMEMGSHVWEMFVWTKQGNITTSAPPAELSRLNSCEQLAVTVVLTTHEKLLFTSGLASQAGQICQACQARQACQANPADQDCQASLSQQTLYRRRQAC